MTVALERGKDCFLSRVKAYEEHWTNEKLPVVFNGVLASNQRGITQCVGGQDRLIFPTSTAILPAFMPSKEAAGTHA
ncbi:hypothetical protein [Pseudomonas chlororaphis]|uniref:hypothetical protein n=1 Tax=Pseudomonas chlororaphis TaxID=587753 RepID=UPI000F58C188|nr:hypothetical protein [Pseudomonas chlororaphis]